PLIEIHEHLAHGAAQTLVHGEPLPLPVAGRTQAAQLARDDAAVALLPLPHPLHEGFPPEAAAVDALLGQHLLHHVLGGDARVVRARYPQRELPLHAAPPHQHVLQGDVERVAHMQRSRHVGRRDDNREHLARLVGLHVEEALLLPELVPLALYVPGDRKSTRLNSSHAKASYAVVCLRKKSYNGYDDDFRAWSC